MTRLQKKAWEFKGEITAFLSLLFILILSIVGALVESASIQLAKNRKRADVTCALESVFAEYDRDLLNEYDVFARFGCSSQVIQNRMEYYGTAGIQHDIHKIELLTDHRGEPFYEQAVRYMKDWLGMEHAEVDSRLQFDDDISVETKEQEVDEQLEQFLQEEGTQLSAEDNPLATVQNLKKAGILSLVVADTEELSTHSIRLEELPSYRELEEGNYGNPGNASATDKAFFVAYLTEHFSNMADHPKPTKLLYEQEYLLGGMESDTENLEKVCKKILGIRMAANYVYLLTDSARQSEAEALALVLSTVAMNPELVDVVKHALLLAWAYGESIVDVRALVSGKKVAAIKSDDTWQLQLANLVKLGTAEEVTEEKDVVGGLSYQEYLIGLLLLEEKEELCMRSLDLMESNLRIRVDQCMTNVQIQSQVELRRGVRDTFLTTFGYQ